MTDGFNAGSKTPGYGGGGDTWGSKTPAYQQPTSNDNWGSNQQPAGNSWGSNPYDAPTPGVNMSAPTPAAMNAPTPGAGSYSAPTPAPYNAPTPAAAPTPGGNWSGGQWGAPTPQAMDAPTPGGQQPYGYAAPTPGAYGGMPETPAANWQDDGPRYVD